MKNKKRNTEPEPPASKHKTEQDANLDVKRSAAKNDTENNTASGTLETAKNLELILELISELKLVCEIAFDKGLIDTHSGNISAGLLEAGGDGGGGEDIFLITKTGRSLLNLKPADFTVASLTAKSGTEKSRVKYKKRARNSGNFAGDNTENADNADNTDNIDNGDGNEASSEIDIHRFILRSFPNSTVFHSHPLNAIALSLHIEQGLIKPPIVKNNRNNKQNKLQKTVIEAPHHSGIGKIDELFEKYPEMDEITPLDFESAYFFPKIYIFPLSFIADIKAKNLNIDLTAKDIFKENGVFMIKSHGAFAWGKTPLDALRWTLMLEASAKIILSF